MLHSLVVLGLAASTMADGFCVAFDSQGPPISLWKWVPEPEPRSRTVKPIQSTAAASIATASNAWFDWTSSPAATSTAISSSSPVSSTSKAAAWITSTFRSSSSSATISVSPDQTSKGVEYQGLPAAPTTLVSKFVQTTSSSVISVIANFGPSKSGSTLTTSSHDTSARVEPTSAATSEVFFGLGTRYGDNCKEEDCWQKGACSFVDYDLPATVDGSTCVSEEIWNNGANCGGCISVAYKSKRITVMVTNLTGGNATHLDMTPGTWAKLTNGYSGGGVDGIEWEWVTCPIAETEPIWIRMHAGASKFWFSATVENARERTAKLEVSPDGGKTWQGTTFHNYNMFVLDGTLPGNTATVRVTSVTGSQVIVDNVSLVSEAITKAGENY